jgi:preprotein translocase subunit SecD
LLTGRRVSTARARYDSASGWLVDVTFKSDDFVTKVATPNVGKEVAIVLDGVVQSAPKINAGITGKTVQISGTFTQSEAKDLALVLKYGSLPVQFDQKQQTVESVSPELGKDQLKAGIAAGLIGLGLVALYMIFFYRLLGLVVWLGLGLTGMIFFALVSYLGKTQGLTLTLAGVTGIIVSVGVTVDSYVVYFERLKDEVRTGKTIRSSLDSGFRRAFRTIVAADLVSLIGAVVLYELAVGSVRGFAYFLGISTAIDLLLAYCFMHPLVWLMSRRPALVRLKGIGIASGLDVATETNL